jgi:CubicO group peptidase (beta-lactamase class C family)
MSERLALEDIPKVQGETEASPAEVGYDATYLGYLDSHFLDLVSRRKLQGASYILSRRGKVFAHKSFGFLRYDGAALGAASGAAPLRPDSIRFLASLTKLFTAVAVLRLYELGKLDLYESVSRYLPELATDMHSGITISHLLTHTSGLRGDDGYFLEPYHLEPPYRKGDKWLKYALQGPLQAAPGEAWIYSSIGFMILGAVVERASGEGFEDRITRTIIEPLKMTRTSFRPSEKLWPEICVTSAEDEKLQPMIYSREARPEPPRSWWGLNSTLKDLWRFGQCLLQGGELEGARILGRKSIEALSRNQLSGLPAFYWGGRKRAYPYGLGAQIAKGEFVGAGSFQHEGSGCSCLTVDPANELVAAYFVPSALGWTVAAVDNPQAIIWGGLQ